jgi:hypothetical protein
VRAAQLTITVTGTDGRSVTLDGGLLEQTTGGQAGKVASMQDPSPERPQPEGVVEGGFTMPLVEFYHPKKRAPGPHPYRWPAPKMARR